MRVRTWVGFCWLAFGLMLSACQSLPTAPQAEQADAANAAIQAGDLVAAAEAYERLAEAGRRQRNQYLLLAAEAWRDQGEIDQVARVLALLQTRKLTAAESLSHDLLQGEVLLARGEAVAAEALLTLPEESIPENRRGRFLELVARALAANGKLGEAVALRLRLNDRLGSAEREDNRNRALQWLAQLPIAERERTLAGLGADQTHFDLLRPTGSPPDNVFGF